MRKYWQIFKVSIQEFLAYRVDFVMPILSTFIRLLLLYFLWKAAYDGTDEKFGYTFDSMFSYYLFVTLAEVFIKTNVENRMAEEIRFGGLSVDLLRPYRYLWKSLFIELGNKALNIAYSGVSVFVLLFVYGQFVHIEGRVQNIPWFILFCSLGYAINLLMGMIMGCFAFWMTDIGGFISFVNQPISFLGGAYFPIELLGIGFLTVSPFVYTKYIPAKVIAGSYQFSEMLTLLLIGIFWIIILLMVYKVLWKLALKKYEAVGQ